MWATDQLGQALADGILWAFESYSRNSGSCAPASPQIWCSLGHCSCCKLCDSLVETAGYNFLLCLEVPYLTATWRCFIVADMLTSSISSSHVFSPLLRWEETVGQCILHHTQPGQGFLAGLNSEEPNSKFLPATPRMTSSCGMKVCTWSQPWAWCSFNHRFVETFWLFFLFPCFHAELLGLPSFLKTHDNLLLMKLSTLLLHNLQASILTPSILWRSNLNCRTSHFFRWYMNDSKQTYSDLNYKLIYESFFINVSCSFKHTAIGECVFWVEILLGFPNGDWSMVLIETWRVGGLWNEHQMPCCKPWLDNAQKTYKWTVVNLMYDCQHHGNITEVQIAWNKCQVKHYRQSLQGECQNFSGLVKDPISAI